ncbi:hypothetical protein Spiaf_1582 [Spirochaeta africana DSM 8902]|uniref:HNH endonuclease n=1 Tax=Spirochaeta africana (strain ATCC 700263 / DSM 8902 / Z-7692) TaxID=889378 RepID=H9UJE8_SPIAZ|nr:hypothetical protein Spiaf_1582 [Spirochaeta africana DSM 8902]
MTREEQRIEIFMREDGRCFVCGAPLDWNCFHLAHVIPQRKHWVKRYGKSVIHHAENMRATCPTDRCNGAVSLGNNHHTVEQHAQRVRQRIAAERESQV